MPSLSMGALSAVAPEELHRGSGNINFIRQLSGTVGANLVVVWLQLRTAVYADELSASQTTNNTISRELPSHLRAHLNQSAISDSLREPLALEYLSQVVEAQAWTLRSKNAFLALAVVYLLALIPTRIFAQTKAPK